jgi:hypothetical protein
MDAVAKNRMETVRRARHPGQPAQEQTGKIDFAMALAPETAAMGLRAARESVTPPAQFRRRAFAVFARPEFERSPKTIARPDRVARPLSRVRHGASRATLAIVEMAASVHSDPSERERRIRPQPEHSARSERLAERAPAQLVLPQSPARRYSVLALSVRWSAPRRRSKLVAAA